jgi:hypothetical protein
MFTEIVGKGESTVLFFFVGWDLAILPGLVSNS